MEYRITPEEIRELQEFLKNHSPDPAWDWADDVFDAPMPSDEFRARCARDILKDLGELPEETDNEEAAEYGIRFYP